MKSTFVFLLVNFGALALGGYLMGEGPKSEWYQALHKAPWTPPGWVFGFAWTTIMICFSLFMSYAYRSMDQKTILIGLFLIQLLLNIIWNPVFFKYHYISWGLLIITSLTIVTLLLLINTYNPIKWKVLLIVPYILWLFIATSLNAYIVLKN